MINDPENTAIGPDPVAPVEVVLGMVRVHLRLASGLGNLPEHRECAKKFIAYLDKNEAEIRKAIS